jgi:ureidoacrylate peracid hydrolase
VEKVAYAAFYMSRLECVLGRAGVRRLLVAGIITNGGVASTVRDAAVRDYDVMLLADGCAVFDAKTHQVSVEALRPVAQIAAIDAVVAATRRP